MVTTATPVAPWATDTPEPVKLNAYAPATTSLPSSCTAGPTARSTPVESFVKSLSAIELFINKARADESGKIMEPGADLLWFN